MPSKDNQYIQHIVMYCSEPADFVRQLGGSQEAFCDSIMAQRAVAMDLVQIGELCSRLTDEAKAQLGPSVPWKEIHGTRDWLVHQYGEIDQIEIWETVVHDVPVLCAICQSWLRSTEQSGPARSSEEGCGAHLTVVCNAVSGPCQ